MQKDKYEAASNGGRRKNKWRERGRVHEKFSITKLCNLLAFIHVIFPGGQPFRTNSIHSLLDSAIQQVIGGMSIEHCVLSSAGYAYHKTVMFDPWNPYSFFLAVWAPPRTIWFPYACLCLSQTHIHLYVFMLLLSLYYVVSHELNSNGSVFCLHFPFSFTISHTWLQCSKKKKKTEINLKHKENDTVAHKLWTDWSAINDI